jgi:hypothetical protein
MLQALTRSKVIQAWFAAIVLIVVTAIALGATMSMGTAVLLLGLSLVPPGLVLMLWPGAQAQTASDVLHDTNRRG